MDGNGLTADTGFAVLRRNSEQRNTKLAVLAERFARTEEVPTPTPASIGRTGIPRPDRLRPALIPVQVGWFDQIAQKYSAATGFIERERE